MESITIKPSSLFYKENSYSYWLYINRLWDNDNTTAPASQSGKIALRFLLSDIPNNMKITKITVNIWCKRSSTIGTCFIGYSDRTDFYSDVYTKIDNVLFNSGTYGVAEQHTGNISLTTEQSNGILGAEYAFIYFNIGSSSVLYEVTLIIDYEPKSSFYIGSTPIQKVYVGNTEASAVYIGDTRIL